MDTDDRFKHLASDPRFKNLKKKQRKVKIDERFQSMFTDEKFVLKYTKDKRGRKQKKTSGDDLKKYYALKNEVGAEEKKSSKKENDKSNEDLSALAESSSDEDKQPKTGTESDEQEISSEVSSSSDESESEEEIEDEEQTEGDINVRRIRCDWQPIDHDAETADKTTRRLAIQNLDWDHLDVKDIYTLIHSVRPPLSVKIYVSDFGKERLKKEELEGPEELLDLPKEDEIEEEFRDLEQKIQILKNSKGRAFKKDDYEDADEGYDPKNDEIRERIRQYQLNRLKYYYAVAEFDSIETAEFVYKELDGLEYEGSSLELDLRFIPDDIEFDAENLKAECNKIPDLASYKAPLFISTALQQTNVKFTWDETDTKRQEKLRRAYTMEELERDDLEAYLASETDDSSEDEGEAQKSDAISVVTANSEVRANKYRQLLKSLEEEEFKKKKVDVDVEWGDYNEDEKRLTKESKLQKQVDHEDKEEFDTYSESDASIDSDPIEEQPLTKRKAKLAKKKTKKGDTSAKKVHENDDELDLLVMNSNNKEDDFNFNPDDERFNAIYDSGLYNIDPSHPNFKRTQAIDLMAERKRQKRMKIKTNDS